MNLDKMNLQELLEEYRRASKPEQEMNEFLGFGREPRKRIFKGPQDREEFLRLKAEMEKASERKARILEALWKLEGF